MKSRGLTLIEVIIASAALAIVLGILSTLLVGNIHQTSIVGARAQANQLGIFLGRQILEGDSRALPDVNSSRSWAYGTLNHTSTGFDTLTAEQQFGNIALYRAVISNQGQPSWAGGSWQVNQYQIEVCWQSPEGEQCVRQGIIGPSPAAASSEIITTIN